MSRFRIRSLALFVGALVVFAACGSDDGEAATPTTENDSATSSTAVTEGSDSPEVTSAASTPPASAADDDAPEPASAPNDPFEGTDEGIPDEDFGDQLTDACAAGDPDSCLELGRRNFPPPSSFTGEFEFEPDLTIQFECFEVGVQEACYEAGLKGIDADTIIGE